MEEEAIQYSGTINFPPLTWLMIYTAAYVRQVRPRPPFFLGRVVAGRTVLEILPWPTRYFVLAQRKT
jgi:hypothetical protein